MTQFAPCPEWRVLLSAYQDQQLAAEERTQVEEHIAQCHACREALALLEADRTRFVTAYAASTGKEDLRAHVMEELRAQKRATREMTIPLTWFRWLTGLSSASVVACLLMLAVMVFPHYGKIIKSKTGASSDAQMATVQKGREDTKIFGAPTTPLIMGVERHRDPSTSFLLDGEVQSHPRHDSGKVIGYEDGPARLDATATGRANTQYKFMLDGSVIKDDDAGVQSVWLQKKDPDTRVFTRRNSRNFGVPGGIQMAYDVNYLLRVKQALQQARQAQKIIQGHEGFIIDFQYGNEDGQRPWATIHGKVPLDQADKALQEIERLGEVRSLTVAGEDLTEQFKAQMDESVREKEHARALEALGKRIPPKNAMNVEEQRHYAEQRAAEARRSLLSLRAQHNLIEFTAGFVEGKPHQPLRFSAVVAGTKSVLHYTLLLLGTVLSLFLLVGVVTSPWTVARLLRRRRG